MKALFIRYLNEVVGLTVMALMAVALIAGQADADFHEIGHQLGRRLIQRVAHRIDDDVD